MLVAVDDRNELKKIWRQGIIPVMHRRSDILLVRLPYKIDNRNFIQQNKKTKPIFIEQYKAWKIPKSWFASTAKLLCVTFGSVYIIQNYREHEKCAPACWNAKGIKCECSCMGANHGMNVSGKWYIVSDTCAIKWGEKTLACKLLTLKPKEEELKWLFR